MLHSKYDNDLLKSNVFFSVFLQDTVTIGGQVLCPDSGLRTTVTATAVRRNWIWTNYNTSISH